MVGCVLFFGLWRRLGLVLRAVVVPAEWRAVCRRLLLVVGVGVVDDPVLRGRLVVLLRELLVRAVCGVRLCASGGLTVGSLSRLPLLPLVDLVLWQGFLVLVVCPAAFVGAEVVVEVGVVDAASEGVGVGESLQLGGVLLGWPFVLAGGGWAGCRLVFQEVGPAVAVLLGRAAGLGVLVGGVRVSAFCVGLGAALGGVAAQVERAVVAGLALDASAGGDAVVFFGVGGEFFFGVFGLVAFAFLAVSLLLPVFYLLVGLCLLVVLGAGGWAYGAARNGSFVVGVVGLVVCLWCVGLFWPPAGGLALLYLLVPAGRDVFAGLSVAVVIAGDVVAVDSEVFTVLVCVFVGRFVFPVMLFAVGCVFVAARLAGVGGFLEVVVVLGLAVAPGGVVGGRAVGVVVLAAAVGGEFEVVVVPAFTVRVFSEAVLA